VIRQNRRTPDAGQGKGGSKESRPLGQDDRKIKHEGQFVQATALFEDLYSVARVLGGEVISGHRGQYVVFAPSWHSGEDRSAIIGPDPRRRHGFYSNSLAGDLWEDIERDAAERLGLSDQKAVFRNSGQLSEEEERAREAAMTRLAMTTWGIGTDPRDTPVEAYLRSRGLSLPCDPQRVIRWVENGIFAKGVYSPMMVCLVRDLITDEPVGIHKTALTPDGQKALVRVGDSWESKRALGPVSRGAVKFGSPREGILGVGEGVETTLSLGQLLDVPVWSLLSAAPLGRLPLLEGVSDLIVAEDQDEKRAGAIAAQAIADLWLPQGRRVRIARPPEGLKDLNDITDTRPKARGA